MKISLIIMACFVMLGAQARADIVLGNPLSEFAVRIKQLDKVIQCLGALKAEINEYTARVGTGWIHERIIPDSLKGLDGK